ncbi:MAG TPA: hypothetical protein VGR88_04510 [Ktedonobacterales bacterium]|nr:hypothetical protein [Ktedonobacterales bacterium]
MNMDDTARDPLDPQWSNVADGTVVTTADGVRLGTVKDRQRDGLLVHGEDGGEDYLVTPADLGRIDESGVHLVVTREQAMKAHWQGTSSADETAPGGMAPGAMTRLQSDTEQQPS